MGKDDGFDKNLAELMGCSVSDVTKFYSTYRFCKNLTGKPVCGNNVTDMSYAYGGCHNIIGPAIIGPNVIDASGSYEQCYNISANAYVYSNNCNVSFIVGKRSIIILAMSGINGAISCNI